MRSEIIRSGKRVRPAFNYTQAFTVEECILQLTESLRNLQESFNADFLTELCSITKTLARIERRLATRFPLRGHAKR